MRRKPSLIVLAPTALAALLALAGATGVYAQATHSGPRQPAPEMQAMHEAHDRQRAQDLRTILRLRPDQDGALTTFLAAHDHTKPPMMDHDGPPPEGLTTPQRLDEMAKRGARKDIERQKHIEALKTFYAALSPEQRQVFDALERMHGPPHGPGSMHGMMHGMHGPGGPPPGEAED